jgi:GntP family gluconate:H+ symporter
MNVTISVMSVGLVGSLQLTHAIVPPTPGPLAAVGIMGADVGKTIIFGSIACLAGSLACWLWGQFIVGPRIATLPSDEYAGTDFLAESDSELPRPVSSYAPIVVPILLISTQSVASLFLEPDHWFSQVVIYIGWPVFALSVGVWLAVRTIKKRDHLKQAKSDWVEEALRLSAMILVVTGLGGSLSSILRGTPAVEIISSFFADYGLPAILLPFVIGIVGNMITGSTTVGVFTAASLVAPMLGNLGLSAEAAVLAGASGSVIIKYVNSSYFWVCTSLSKLQVNDAIYAYGGATLIGGIVSFITVFAMWSIGLI